MDAEPPDPPVRIACDAMCGGVARWLRLLGIDATYAPGIDDAALVRHALAEGRVVVSSDGKLFERRTFTSGELRGLRLPVGLRLLEQVRFVFAALHLAPRFPRCSICNGLLEAVGRAEVGDIVPARSLVWAREFYRCQECGHVFWEGTHWRRIRAVRERIASPLGPRRPGDEPAPG